MNFKIYSKDGYREMQILHYTELIIPSVAKWYNEISINEMKNRNFSTIAIEDNDTVFFISDDFLVIMYHDQECCEDVEIDDVVGDWQDLINSPLLKAEEVSSENMPPKDPLWDESYTWTFYKLATTKGYVDIKWYGVSNGYYSEEVSLCVLTKDQFPEYFESLHKFGIV